MTTTIIREYDNTNAFLSDEEYTILRPQSLLTEYSDYQPGRRVRLISQEGKPPGHHWDSTCFTVCRVNAQKAEFIGIKKADLQLCQPITEQDVTDQAIECIAHMVYSAECEQAIIRPRTWNLISTEEKHLYLRRARSSVRDWLANEASALAAWEAFAKSLATEIETAP